MHLSHWRRLGLVGALALLCSVVAATDIRLPDHYEFDATLAVPFQARAGQFPIRIDFDYPGAGAHTQAGWKVEVLSPAGGVVFEDVGIATLQQGRGSAVGRWNGLGTGGRRLPAGYYTVRLRAVPMVALAGDAALTVRQRVDKALALFADEVVEQRLDVMLGQVPRARLTPMRPLPTGAVSAAAIGAAPARQTLVAATGGLPYTIYYGNLHSQTNHSDGGTPVASCGGAEVPQAGTYGPADAYAMMQTQAGGDFLLTSEHNHMYDGSTGTNTSASPSTANALFSSGLTAAASYRSAHPQFLALYGTEWGVISNGGHLNILNPDGLANWGYNSSNQLIGTVATVKSDYAGLYAVMKARGWLGQFNHPASSGQFQINGVALAYDANGADVMVLAEVLNSSAFSTNTSMTESGRSSYEAAWNTLLEAGYRLAPASNQGNHCANWGLSFTNRTGVLLPSGTALTPAAFFDALRARRAFATEDRTAQLVLTANGHVMGEVFSNTGPLTLQALYASTSGQSVQRVQFFEGVPGRNGTVTQLAEGSASYTFTPTPGKHFYYVKVTQADGLRLWSAPVWVDQSGSPPADTVPPSVTASETGSSGTITLSATASDNVGVSKVEFLIDGVLVGTDTTAPYALTYDSTALSNGSHTLVARAYDAAGNVGTSAAVTFSVSNTAADTTPPTVNASETGSSGTITLSATASDNVGVSKVEFLVDGVLKGTVFTPPYTLALNSTTLSDGSHTLVARAYDAAGNVGTSSAVAFTISNASAAVERIVNGGFEAGSSSWTASTGVITSDSTYPAKAGSWKAWLDGYGSSHTDSLYQTLSIPSGITRATLSFWLRVDSSETTTTTAYDTLKVQLRDSAGNVLTTLATYSNLNKGSSYVQRSFDVTAWKGRTVRVYFLGVEDASNATSFLIDEVSLKTQ
ncbi:Ig-like domain-containing protein [Thermomonas hydrothermalis]|uniref:Ig-like domain (Group 3) n=1 Tax=Thermomonas hydrothermalis TaxID=213588 RepID=A0A1M4YK53_9GAMM|nr:Ig-like domain-containing protein [Thermomonas hydrothermalis]SHF06110.1 Ig-like domain (group 3) [Thermomonas hydrothermalis]